MYERIIQEMGIAGIKTISDLERRAEVSLGTIRNIRYGHTPKPDSLVRIANVLGVPNLYAQERGGWSTDHTLKRVYQHTFSQQRIEVDKMVDSFFESKVQQKTEHKSRKESTKKCT